MYAKTDWKCRTVLGNLAFVDRFLMQLEALFFFQKPCTSKLIWHTSMIFNRTWHGPQILDLLGGPLAVCNFNDRQNQPFATVLGESPSALYFNQMGVFILPKRQKIKRPWLRPAGEFFPLNCPSISTAYPRTDGTL
jgi:hypothetical protein